MASTLQRLIVSRKADQRWSYQDIAERGGMSRSTVYKLATATYEGIPRRRTVAALAKGLGLPEATVREAAMQAAQTDPTWTRTDQGREVLIGYAGALTAEQIDHVNRYIDLMIGDD